MHPRQLLLFEAIAGIAEALELNSTRNYKLWIDKIRTEDSF